MDGPVNGHAETLFQSHYDTLFDYLRHEAQQMGVERSFYTLDLGDVLLKVQRWKENMPNVRPFYAVKTNSDPTLLRFLVLLGFSFDCASEGEIRMVLEAGASPTSVIFAHTVKTPGALQYAESVGVHFMTFDGEGELHKIKKHHPQAKLLLRLIPQEVKCSFDLSEKFGCHPDEAERLLTLAKELDLDVMGVSFHVGGLCKTSSSYTASIEASRKVFDVARTLGFHFRILDIGGGFKGARGTEDAFQKITREIRKALEDWNFSDSEIETIAEPGTYFVASAATLVTGVIGAKQVNNTSQGNHVERVYYLNESIYGSFFNGVQEYDIIQKPLLEESELRQRAVSRSKVWGHTCCGCDLLVGECPLPHMKEGEHLVWYNMGAYCRVLCSTFCGVPLPPTRHLFTNYPSLNWKWVTNKRDVENAILKSCVILREN